MADNNESLQGTQTQLLCAKGCGFFGSASTLNMCSKCFREHQKSTAGDAPASTSTSSASSHPPQPVQRPEEANRPQDAPVVVKVASPSVQLAPPLLPNFPDSTIAAPSNTTPTLASKSQSRPIDEADDEGTPPPRKIQKNMNRCFSCKKKVGLTGFKCRCGYVYCGEHRYSDKHDCDFDYKSEAKAQLEKANPVVVASKINKI